MIEEEGQPTTPKEITQENKIDYFRDTPIRLLGYANEVGEAFRQLIPVKLVRLSYVVASTYCFCDAASKSIGSKPTKDQIESGKSDNQVALETFVEAAVWQGLASVIIPGFTINRICWLSSIALRRGLGRLVAAEKQRYLVTGIGLSSIPFIIHPIDTLVDHVVDKAVRDYNRPNED